MSEYGSFGEGFSSAFGQQQQLAQKNAAMQQQQQLQLTEQINKNIGDLFSSAASVAKAVADSGQPSNTAAGQIQPLRDAAIQTAQLAVSKGLMSPQLLQAIGARFDSLGGYPAAQTTPKLYPTGSDPFDPNKKTYSTYDASKNAFVPVGQGGGEPARPGQTNLTGPDRTSSVVSTQDIPPGAPAVASSVPTPNVAMPAPSFADRFDAANPAPAPAAQFKLSMAAPSTNKLPADVQPGQPAIDYAINNNVYGDEFLKALPPVARNKVVDVANYKVPLTTESKRQGAQSQLASWVHQYTGGEYDAKWYQPMQAVIKDFMAGTSNASPAQAMVVGNTAIQHLGTMAGAVDAMSQVPGLLDKIAKSNTSFVSYAANALKNKAIEGTSEGMALRSFMTARNRYVDEIVKFYGGAQGGSEEDRKRSIDTLDAAVGLPSLYAAMNTEAHLLDSKVNALQDRWKTGQLGPKFADTALRATVPDYPIVQQKSKAVEDDLARKYLSIRFAGGQNSIDRTGTPVSPQAGQVIIQNGFRYDAQTHQPLGPVQ